MNTPATKTDIPGWLCAALVVSLTACGSTRSPAAQAPNVEMSRHQLPASEAPLPIQEEVEPSEATLVAVTPDVTPPPPPNHLRWAPAGTGNMRPMGVESNGTVTYACRAIVANEWWLGRTWPGAGCFIGIDGRREYAAPNNFEVLVGDGGALVTTHHGGVVPNAALEGRLVLCVAMRATGERVPGWLAPKGKVPGDCFYEWYGGDAHESHYQLLVIGDEDALARNVTDLPAQCSGGLCQLLDEVGLWIAADPARAALLAGSAILSIYTCALSGGRIEVTVKAGVISVECRARM